MKKYNQGVQQQEQTYAQGNQGLAGALQAYNASMTPASQQYSASQVPASLYTALLGATPLASTSYGSSQVGTDLSGAGSILGGIGSLYKSGIFN